MVDGAALEKRCAAMHREFESPPLRHFPTLPLPTPQFTIHEEEAPWRVSGIRDVQEELDVRGGKIPWGAGP